MSKIDHSIFHGSTPESRQAAIDDAYGHCPECSSSLTIKSSRNGPFLGCSSYPNCEYTKPLKSAVTNETLKVIDGSSCPECSENLAIKKGRFGLYIGCTGFPVCHHIESINQSTDSEVSCPSCGKGTLTSRTNRQGKTFYSCTQYPKCKYVVNAKPVAGTCNVCGWGLLLEKKTQQKTVNVCALKSCSAEQN